MRAKTVIAILLSVIIVASAGIISLDTTIVQDHLTRVHAEDQLKSAGEQLTLKMTMYLADCLNSARTLAQAVGQVPVEEWGSQPVMTTLKNLSEDMEFPGISLSKTDGTGYDAGGNSLNASFCPYFQRALLGDTTIAFTPFHEGSEAADAVLTMPVHSNGAIAGVLRIALSPERIRSLLSINTFRGNEDVYLVRRSGEILAGPAGFQKSAGFPELLDKDDDRYAELEQVMRQGREILVKMTLDESSHYINFKGVKDSNDWGVLVAIPEDVLLGLYRDDRVSESRSLLTGFLVIILVMLGILVWLSVAEIRQRYTMERLAYFDEITQGINYNRFKKDVTALLHRTADAAYAVAMLEIDNFNYIRDFFGAPEADRIRLYIAKTVRANLKSDELICRYMNENFLLLLRYHNKEELSDRINFLDSMLCSFEGDEIKNDKYEFRLHYGIYCPEGNGEDIDRMAEKAARALQMIKNDRQKVFEFYSESMQKKALDENEIEEHMFTALEEREFLVFLQPKFDLHTGRQAGAEALVRWMHPEKGLLYPGRFISVFEKNGFIVKLDMYMLDEICHRLKIWISKGYHPMPISLNISRLNLFDEEFVPKLIATLEQYGIPANLVQLEMSEQVVTNNIGKLSSLIDHLKDYGFLISIDNFGTGTTSMNTLYTIPVDELKLDRKFLLEVEKTDRGKNVIQSIIEMAKRLNINVVSEGVENKAQARMLQELGCDMIQGFAFSEPMPFREYENYAFGPRADEVNIW
ncbi:MAG: EAL domain-containing protein [Clostridiaceae bacterium]|jgi:diguanylate cyclase (GGDEF)-like protein|nr:EAL domain-containing protein [Clostridiaceae bacterium]